MDEVFCLEYVKATMEMKMRKVMACIVATTTMAMMASAQREDILIADFEGEDYGAWQAEGAAFGSGPAQGTLPHQMNVTGFKGKGFVNSYNGGDGPTGTLTSPLFAIERPFITFLIGGGGWEGKTCMNLLVDGKTVRTATGSNTRAGGSEELEPASWNVSDLLGKTARIQIVDAATGGWGHINVDHITACDALPPMPQKNATRDFTANKRWLLLPVKNGAKKCKMEVRDGAEVLRFFDIELAESDPDWWAPLDLSAWQNRTLTLWVDKLPGGSKGLENAKLADAPVPAEGLYREPLRPLLHFSPRRGWLNDPNGLSYYNGEYHLFFQHNPYGVGWGNMHWGHAVSKDLVHWQEVDEALYPDALGPMFSGSAVVDHANTSGFGKDGKAPLVLIYTAAGNPATQCVAYSLDGRTFTKHAGNPVVANITSGNRDPKVFWHAPTQRWIMALYVGHPDKLHTTELLSSPNLREWSRLSVISGDKGGGNYLYECPDLFELANADASFSKWVHFGADGQYAVGAFDGTTFTPEAERLRGYWGNCYYAAQTFSDMPDGRRVLIGWLQAPSPGMPFNQCMSLPHELGLTHTPDGIRLTHTPIKELAALRGGAHPFQAETIKPGDANPLAGFEADAMELRLTCDMGTDAELALDLRGVPLRYDTAKQELTIGKHKTPWPISDAKLGLTLYLDRTCVEVFSQDGLLYAPVAVIPKAEANGATVTVGRGEVKNLSGTAYALESCWK